MAEDSGQEKTEEPSEQRKEKARDEGQIARTQELGTFITIATSMVMLNHWGPEMAKGFMDGLRAAFYSISNPNILTGVVWMKAYAYPLFKITISFSLMLLVLTVAGSLFQTGFVFSSKSLVPKFNSVNPFAGIKRIFTVNVLVQMLKNFLKLAVIGTIVYQQLKSQIDYIILLSTVPAIEAMLWCAKTIASIILKVSIFLAVLAVFDYLYQWYTNHQKLMMSRQELKDEMKQSQLPDSVRNKVRSVAMERAKRKIHKEVPQADVIITNPTHFAVAIRYRRFKDPAPRVVAKGQDLLAATIRNIAKEHNVPLYEYPVLARKLYRTVKAGEMIPGDMFEPVAKVLAFVYRMYKDRKKVTA